MSLPIAPGTYGIDTVHSQLGFSVTHLGISTVRGTFDRYSGALYVGESLADTVIAIEAEMSSINSGNVLRDEHVHNADFLDVANHPQMLFRSTAIEESGSGYSMTGDLTIRGTTLSVTFDASFNGSAIFPIDGSTHHGFCATGSISRSAFGVSYGVPLISDEVSLFLDVQFVEPLADDAQP
jgi:polyisoprenoid-binding protein YceI